MKGYQIFLLIAMAAVAVDPGAQAPVENSSLGGDLDQLGNQVKDLKAQVEKTMSETEGISQRSGDSYVTAGADTDLVFRLSRIRSKAGDYEFQSQYLRQQLWHIQDRLEPGNIPSAQAERLKAEADQIRLDLDSIDQMIAKIRSWDRQLKFNVGREQQDLKYKDRKDYPYLLNWTHDPALIYYPNPYAPYLPYDVYRRYYPGLSNFNNWQIQGNYSDLMREA